MHWQSAACVAAIWQGLRALLLCMSMLARHHAPTHDLQSDYAHPYEVHEGVCEAAQTGDLVVRMPEEHHRDLPDVACAPAAFRLRRI